MRRMALELLPAGDRALAELVLRADDLPRVAVGALPDRQGEAVVALLADHPVAHVPEPVELALLEADARRQPRHLARGSADRLAQRIHGDEPLVDEAEDQLRPAAPAVGVGVGVLLGRHEQSLALEVGGHVPRDVRRRVVRRARDAAGLPVEAVDEDAELVDRVDDRQVEGPGEGEVLLPAPRRDVDDAGPLGVVDLVPRDHSMRDPGGGRQLVERTGVGEVDQLGAPRLADDGRISGHPRLRSGAHPPPASRRDPRRAGRSARGGPRRRRCSTASTASSSRPAGPRPRGRGCVTGRRSVSDRCFTSR